MITREGCRSSPIEYRGTPGWWSSSRIVGNENGATKTYCDTQSLRSARSTNKTARCLQTCFWPRTNSTLWIYTWINTRFSCWLAKRACGARYIWHYNRRLNRRRHGPCGNNMGNCVTVWQRVVWCAIWQSPWRNSCLIMNIAQVWITFNTWRNSKASYNKGNR